MNSPEHGPQEGQGEWVKPRPPRPRLAAEPPFFCFIKWAFRDALDQVPSLRNQHNENQSPTSHLKVQLTLDQPVENLCKTFDSTVSPLHLWIQPTNDGKVILSEVGNPRLAKILRFRSSLKA